MKAIIIGATGATGTELLELLLNDDNYEEVILFVRREIEIKQDKLTVHCIDFDKPEEWKALVQGDVLFSCLGTTLEAAGSKEAQWKIDYDYQYEFAKLAQDNNISTYVLVSSSNASADSYFFYSKMKGKLEEAVKALRLEKCIILRPPLLERVDSERKMEVLGVKVLRFLNALGILKSQKPMHTKVLAKAMIQSVKSLNPGHHTIEGQSIRDFV